MNTKDFIRLGVPLGQAIRLEDELKDMSLLTSAATINGVTPGFEMDDTTCFASLMTGILEP
jgi:hypothetical protein